MIGIGKYKAVKDVSMQMGISVFLLPDGASIEVTQIDKRNEKALVKCGRDTDWMSFSRIRKCFIPEKKEYHSPDSCNKCSEENDIETTSSVDGRMCEAKTKCTTCGHEDYWAYGYYESGANMISNCETYSFDHNKG